MDDILKPLFIFPDSSAIFEDAEFRYYRMNLEIKTSIAENSSGENVGKNIDLYLIKY